MPTLDSEETRIHRVGKIHLGVRQDKGYPQPTDYFVCPEEVTKVFGKQPKLLRVMFPTDNVQDFAPEWYKAYSNLRGLICRGDGRQATALVDLDTGEIAGRESKNTAMKQVACNPEQCLRFKAKKCRPVMNFMFLMPEVPGLGVWQIDTTSAISRRNIRSQAKALNQLLGRCSMIPLTLRLVPQDVSPEGVLKTVHVMQVDCLLTLNELYERCLKAPAGTFVIPPVGDDIPDDLFPQDVIQDSTADPQIAATAPKQLNPAPAPATTAPAEAPAAAATVPATNSPPPQPPAPAPAAPPQKNAAPAPAKRTASKKPTTPLSQAPPPPAQTPPAETKPQQPPPAETKPQQPPPAETKTQQAPAPAAPTGPANTNDIPEEIDFFLEEPDTSPPPSLGQLTVAWQKARKLQAELGVSDELIIKWFAAAPRLIKLVAITNAVPSEAKLKDFEDLAAKLEKTAADRKEKGAGAQPPPPATPPTQAAPPSASDKTPLPPREPPAWAKLGFVSQKEWEEMRQKLIGLTVQGIFKGEADPAGAARTWMKGVDASALTKTQLGDYIAKAKALADINAN